MRTFTDVGAVVRDADFRLKRVVLVLEALFVIAMIGCVWLDAQPRPRRLECVVHRAQTMSHYPHPYGEPPPVEWTRCEWR